MLFKKGDGIPKKCSGVFVISMYLGSNLSVQLHGAFSQIFVFCVFFYKAEYYICICSRFNDHCGFFKKENMYHT